ncbi:MAG: esterase [Clostridiales bacterium]|nr:MAG: esterase [Clostridiales bacterium]
MVIKVALFSISHAAGYLGMNVGITVVYPDGADKNNPPKVLYLLHGLSDDDTMWLRRSNVERYNDGRNLCIVMPTGHRSFYTDMKRGLQYFSYLSLYLPKFIENTFNVATGRENTFAAGLSMGGYGAVKLGLTYPERYSKVASFSGCFEPDKHKEIFEFSDVYGDEISSENNVFTLLENAEAANKPLPKIFQACGNSDFVLQDNINFAEKAKALNYDIIYEQTPGNHEWEFWDRNIKKTIAWLMED